MDLDTCPLIYNQLLPVWRLIWSTCTSCRQVSYSRSRKRGIPANSHWFAVAISRSQNNLHSGCVYCFTAQPHSCRFHVFPIHANNQSGKRNKQENCYVMFYMVTITELWHYLKRWIFTDDWNSNYLKVYFNNSKHFLFFLSVLKLYQVSKLTSETE